MVGNGNQTDTPALPGFTPREQAILAMAWHCTKSGEMPQIDYTRLAAMSNLSTAASATTAWCGIKRKLNAMNPDGNGNSPSASGASSSAPATPRKRKSPTKKAGAADSATPTKTPGAADGDGEQTPASKKRRSGAGKKNAAGNASPTKGADGKVKGEGDAQKGEEEEDSKDSLILA